MSIAGPYDPLVVCNVLLDESSRRGMSISHLSLQKLLYFAHGAFLVANKRPLVSGYFEAWQHGPVHPTAFKAFKKAGAQPIHFRASRHHLLTGVIQPLPELTDVAALRTIEHVVFQLGPLTAGRLVEIAHARQAPWHFVVEEGRSSMALGLRIPDSLIVERYKHHKISVGAVPVNGEPLEDAPFT